MALIAAAATVAVGVLRALFDCFFYCCQQWRPLRLCPGVEKFGNAVYSLFVVFSLLLVCRSIVYVSLIALSMGCCVDHGVCETGGDVHTLWSC